jgi:hypothetical protein
MKSFGLIFVIGLCAFSSQGIAQGRTGLREVEPNIIDQLERQEKTEFEDQIQNDLLRLGDRINSLQAQAFKKHVNRRNEYTERLRELLLQKNQIDNQLSDLRGARLSDWQDDKASLRLAVTELESSINRVEDNYPNSPFNHPIQ